MNSIEFLKQEVPKFFKGDVAFDDATLEKYSHDASLFTVRPQIVLFPKDKEDVKAIVRFVSDNKDTYSDLSITARSAGTDMSGGPLSESIILDFTKYMHGIVRISNTEATVLPGTFFRDFEPETEKRGVMMPCFPASKHLCAWGGMISNNCAGEKTLKYGKMEDYVLELKVVLRDGNEYTVKPLSPSELEAKTRENTVEGEVYRELKKIIEENRDLIMSAKPNVSKNSSGYYLWNVWSASSADSSADEADRKFNLAKLIVGSQGTLGLVTEATVKLVPIEKSSGLFVIFMPTIERLGELINEILPLKPETVESYDDSTMKFAFKYVREIAALMKTKNFLSLVWRFIPEAFMTLTGGIPKLILLVEFTGASKEEVDKKISELQGKVTRFGFKTRKTKSEADAEKYWTIRRESFSLLRKHVRGRRTAPFIDDVVVRPEHLPKFLPAIKKILDDYKVFYTIAGHAGNGNFHIIPLMDMKDRDNVRIISEVSDKVYDLVASMGGSITAEHNDGIVRTPYLGKIFSKEVLELFKKTKEIFDPKGIFNPGKKVGITKEYMISHLRND